MKNFLLLFLLLKVSILEEYLVGGSSAFTREHTIHVVSNLPSNSQPLKVHCASGDDELGYHYLYKEKILGIHTYQSWWVAKSDGIYFSNQTKPTLLEKRYDWDT